MRKLILIFCGVFCCLTALHAKDPVLYLYQVDALDKVFKDRRYFVDEIDTLAVARGEYATLQVVIKSNREVKEMRAYVESVAGEAGKIEGAQTGWVGYVRAGRKYQPTSKDLLRTPSDYFPDPDSDGCRNGYGGERCAAGVGHRSDCQEYGTGPL